MKSLTLKCVVCIMFVIANKNYVIRPDSNSYLGQQYLFKWTMSKICKGGTCSYILGDNEMTIVYSHNKGI